MSNSNFSVTFTLAQLASKLKIGRNTLTALLRTMGIFQDQTKPYQQYIDCGYFLCKQKKHGWSPNLYPYTLVTYKGFVWLRKVLEELGEQH